MGFPYPHYIQLYPTARCNQRCLFCFNTASDATSHTPDLTYDKALKLLDILTASGIREIDIMGGEPLLLDWMSDFIASAAHRGMSANISTNGSSPSVLRTFSGLGPESVTLGVSLEGSNEERHNRLTRSANFRQALSSIQELVAMNMDPVVKTVLMRSSADDLQNIVDILFGSGVTRYYLIHMDLFSRDDFLRREALSYPDFLSIYERLKATNPDMGIFRVNASCFDKDTLPVGVRCAGGVRKLSLMPDGSVYPCNLFHSMPNFCLGNIFEDSLSDIWSNPILDYFREFRSNRCGIENCANRRACTGGCPAHGLYHYGSADMHDIRCAGNSGLSGITRNPALRNHKT